MGGAAGTPDLVTRDELYERLLARLASRRGCLTACERDVMIRAAARTALTEPSVLGRRKGRSDPAWSPRRFASTISCAANRERFTASKSSSRDVGYRRGRPIAARARMLAQTRFLAATFRGYERRVIESARATNMCLRDRLMAEPSPNPIRDIVVSVGDWISDPNGLYLGDFDLLTRCLGPKPSTSS